MWFYVQFFIIVSFIFSLGLLVYALKRRSATRTLENWRGAGIEKDLGPIEVAVLLGLHPSTVVATILAELEVREMARLVSPNPIRVVWLGKPADDSVSEAFRLAIDDEGGLPRDGVFQVLQAAYERVNEKMLAHSGRETAVYHRNFASGLWDEVTEREQYEPAIIPWLLLHDALLVWDEIGDGPGTKRLKELIRTKGMFVQHLLDVDDYLDEARKREGYFRFMPKLVDEFRHAARTVGWGTYPPSG